MDFNRFLPMVLAGLIVFFLITLVAAYATGSVNIATAGVAVYALGMMVVMIVFLIREIRR